MKASEAAQPKSKTLLFLKSALASPDKVRAVLPSSRSAAKLITSGAQPGDGPVLELGPGTGVFTQALIERGIPERDLVLVEIDRHFARFLRQKYPAATVLEQDIATIDLQEITQGVTVQAIVSGLPLLAMKDEIVKAILERTLASLAPQGGFYQITYGPTPPVKRHILAALNLEAKRIGIAIANVPPAFIFRFSRRTP